MISLAFVSTLSASASTRLRGAWGGEQYSFDLDDAFDDIEGTWGDRAYDLEVDDSFNNIEGTLVGMRVDINVDASFHDVEGRLPCGTVDLEYDLNFYNVEGTFCGERVDLELASKEQTLATVRDILTGELAASFPLPVRGAVRRFVLERLDFDR